jgi:hypothetical protein
MSFGRYLMELDPKKMLEEKLNSKNGIHVSVSIDIRTVEKFLKWLFGRKKKTEEKKENDTK